MTSERTGHWTKMRRPPAPFGGLDHKFTPDPWRASSPLRAGLVFRYTQLKNTTVLSIGHRPDLAAYHTRTLQLVHGVNGDRLRLKPPVAPPMPPSPHWLQRFGDWLLNG